MIIRPIKKSEIKQASKIVGLNYSKVYEKSSYREIKAMFDNRTLPPQYLVAEEKGKLIGFAGYTPSWMDYSVYTIFWVNVSPKYQGKGIGTNLVEASINKIRSIKSTGNNSINMILITATTKNSIFYNTKFGFKRIYKIGKDEYLMGLDLRK